jgi:hypothetical protein
MELYWKEMKKGLDLVVKDDEDDEHVVGGVRLTKKGIEAMARTQGYDPGRAIKGLPTIEEGKTFVEQFKPWIDFFGVDLDISS